MRDDNAIKLAVEIDRLVLECRLREVALVAQTDRKDRVGALAAVLSKLTAGAYLVGCGPYCCGVLPLTVEEVVLGRPPSPLESSPDKVVDFTVNDATWLIPREVSRVHATVLRRRTNNGDSFFLRDENSRTGTYINGQPLGSGGSCQTDEILLRTGDVITLGPSAVNAYVFVQIA